MIRLYHAPLARSTRVLWLLEELGLAYEVEKLGFRSDVLQSPAYLAKNPLGRIPTLEDGDLVLFESGAIVQYLIERYGNGRLAPAPGTRERALYLQWLHWAEATAIVPVVEIAAHTVMRPEAERIPAVLPRARENAAKAMAVLDRELASRPYLVGRDLTGADIMMGYTCHLAKLLGPLTDAHPNTLAYLERLSGRRAFQKAFAP